jgi:uncharacterized protein DUF4199
MKDPIKKIEFKFGMITCLALILLFFIMKYFDLIQIVELRCLNFFVLLGGVNAAFRNYRKQTEPNVEYFSGFFFGFYTCIFAVIPFALFVFLYLWKVDPSLVFSLKSNSLFMGVEITAEKAAITTMIEGIVSGVLISYILMQYYRSGFNNPIKKNQNIEA